MIVRALDSTGDWQYGKGKNDYKRGVDATAQNIKTRLSMFLGDCFFALQVGIDWFNLLGSKQPVALNLAIGSVILNTQDVTAIATLSVDITDLRRFEVAYNVFTDFAAIAAAFNPASPATNFLLLEDGGQLLLEDGGSILL